MSNEGASRMRPLKDRLHVKKLEAASTTEAGLFIPEKSREATTQGTVLAVGPFVLDVEVGDVVLFGKYSGTTLEDGTLIICEEDILAYER